jgi:hypothetical protein
MSSDSIEKSDYTPRTFWGWVATVTAVLPGTFAVTGAGAVNGAIQYGMGGEFLARWDKPFEHFDAVVGRAAKWGDDNSEFLTKAAIGGVVSNATGAAGKEIIHRGHFSGSGN